jgi:hypothetical protein
MSIPINPYRGNSGYIEGSVIHQGHRGRIGYVEGNVIWRDHGGRVGYVEGNAIWRDHGTSRIGTFENGTVLNYGDSVGTAGSAIAAAAMLLLFE